MSIRSMVRRPVTGAVLGQGTQALAGLVLQVAAARYLGAAGLAAFALGYGLLVLATAVCSGLVGDSLTVLDRMDARIRAGLHGWTAAVSALAGALGAGAALLSGALPWWAGLLVGPAAAAFIVEDTLRRLLMASGRFWSLPAVDGASLLLALGTLVVAGATGGLSLASFVVALLVGQTGAALVAWWRLPAGSGRAVRGGTRRGARCSTSGSGGRPRRPSGRPCSPSCGSWSSPPQEPPPTGRSRPPGCSPPRRWCWWPASVPSCCRTS
ncbi:hypothetical protein [Blastococcus brunescens]|uniref:Polysaccharide biosynthesis protein n=1 Tax=Blastococcus brunescens TaxID=1564165 RepID=A0ABZ1B1N4_9ACTN|nr:hypothetical protein [Blastococcus sp. BMG 8361]WRL64722.1 hypothetical protein U6N30_02780 [Blastococcus sp. BMG 8361]